VLHDVPPVDNGIAHALIGLGVGAALFAVGMAFMKFFAWSVPLIGSSRRKLDSGGSNRR
jgi:hypothetical protein